MINNIHLEGDFDFALDLKSSRSDDNCDSLQINNKIIVI